MRYKHKATNYNGISYKIQELIPVRNNHSFRTVTLLHNRMMCDFLKSIGETSFENLKGLNRNATKISSKYYPQFIEWLKENWNDFGFE